jgi:adenylosuccinate synthase
MSYLCDIIVGLQNGFEGKTKLGLNLIQNNYYDLCIKVNGGTKNSPIIYNNEEILLKEIPYSILFNVKTLIGNSCVINLIDLLDDIEKLKVLDIPLTNLFISNKASIVQYQHTNETKRNGVSIYGMEHLPTYRDKYNNRGIQYGNLSYTEIMKYLNNNIIEKVDSKDIINESKKILLYQFYSFNLDIDWGGNSSVHCSSGFCCTLINPRSVNNIYGVCSIYDIIYNSNNPIIECNILNKISEMENNINNYTVNCNWLSLDKLINNIKINGINIIVFTRCDILINLQKYKLIHKFNVVEFKTWKDIAEYIRTIIGEIYCINEIIFSYSKINV